MWPARLLQYYMCYLKDQWECHTDTHQHGIPFCNWLQLQCWCSSWSHPSVLCLNNWSGLKSLFRFAIDGICLRPRLAFNGREKDPICTSKRKKLASVGFIAWYLHCLVFQKSSAPPYGRCSLISLIRYRVSTNKAGCHALTTTSSNGQEALDCWLSSRLSVFPPGGSCAASCSHWCPLTCALFHCYFLLWFDVTAFHLFRDPHSPICIMSRTVDL